MMKRFINFLAGAALGGLVGAAIALLLAPKSGEALRGQLRTRGEHLQAEVRRAAAERRAELEEQLATLREPK
jgi:gas vesicle protein